MSEKKRRTRREQGKLIFALDIGTRTVVGILAEKTEDGCRVIDMETAAHDKRSMTDGQIDDIEAVSRVIIEVKTALEKRRSIKLRHVCIAAAGRALKTMRASWEYKLDPQQTITEKELRDAELEAVRKTEEKFSAQYDTTAFYCVGHSVISLSLDGYKTSKPDGHRGETLETEIIAAFLPAYVVESLCAAVDLAGLDVAGLTLEPIAAMNAVVPQELRLINIALCDIGAGTSDVAVSRDGSVVAYGMATTAGDEITEHLMKQLLIDFPTAERLKTSELPENEYTDILLCKKTITKERIAELVTPVTEELAAAVCSEIIAANATPPQAVFLVGGGSRLNGLAPLVAEGLGLPIERVMTGRREIMRGISVPDDMEIGTEHATPLGIALTSGRGISYDFTTITLNGKKLRTLDTNRLIVIELLNLGGFKPEMLIGKSGSSLTFTLNGERITLRGTPSVPAEIYVNGRTASLNTTIRKGDEVTVIPAENGESAAAYLSDYIELPPKTVTVNLFGREVKAGVFAAINGNEATSDREISNGDMIAVSDASTLSGLLAYYKEDCAVLLNGEKSDGDTLLKDGDIITRDENGTVSVTINGAKTELPARADGKPLLFLDVAALFSDNPTLLLSSAHTATLNGKIVRLDEPVRSGDEIVLE